MSVSLDVVVIGAGLAGLGTAIAAQEAGHRVTVIEATSSLAEVGAGLQILPQTVNVFKKWGIADELEDMAAVPIRCIIHRYSDGHILAEEPKWAESMINSFGAPVFDLHRADLQKVLYRKAESLGVKFRFSSPVQTINCEDAKLVLKTGDEIEANLIIAADGIHSVARAAYLGRPDPPKPTGDLAYRIVLHADQVEDQELREMITKPNMNIWLGPQAHVIAYSLKDGKQYNVVLLVPDDLPENVSRSAGDTGEMRDLFKNWDPLLSRFLALVEKVDKWKLMHHPGLERWGHPSGKFIMLGDAVHPMLPYLAMGANSAIEDAVVLGECLRAIKTKEDLPKVLQAFQDIRMPRSKKVIALTHQQRLWNHLEDGPEQEARDAIFVEQQPTRRDGKFPSAWTNPEIWSFLCGYDPWQAAAEGLRKAGL